MPEVLLPAGSDADASSSAAASAVRAAPRRFRWPDLDRHTVFNVTWRSLLALFGGYGVAALSASALAQGLPLARVDAVTVALMLSFVVHAVVAMAVVAAATVWRATWIVAVSAGVFTLWARLAAAGA